MSAPRSTPATLGAAPEPAAQRQGAVADRNADRALLATLVGLALVAQWLWMDASVGPYDEGLVLFGADRVLRGDVPYRDFWTLYGPASFYVEAGLFRLFGETALVGRGLDAVVKAAVVGLTFLIVARLGRRALAAAAAVLVLGLLIYLRNYGVPLFPAVCASLVAVVALHDVAESADRRAALIAGIAVGVAILFRHDLGVYALIGCLVFFMRGRTTALRDRQVGRKGLALRFGAGVLVVLAPVALGLLWVVPLHDLYVNLVRIPIVIYPQVRALPFPSLADAVSGLVQHRSFGALGLLVVYLPLAATAVAIASETMRGRAEVAGTDTPATASTLQLLLLLNVLFFAKGLVRVSPLHMGAALVVSVILVAATAARAHHALWRRALLVIGALACAGLVAKPFVSAGERSAHSGGSASEALLSDRWISQAAALCKDASLPRLQCLRLDRDRTTVARYLLEHGGRGQRVYIGAGRHDRAGDRAAEGAGLAHAHLDDDHAGRQRPPEPRVAHRVGRAAAPPHAGLPERGLERRGADQRRRRVRQERARRARQPRSAADARDHGDLGHRDLPRRADRPRRPRPVGGLRGRQAERRGADRAAHRAGES